MRHRCQGCVVMHFFGNNAFMVRNRRVGEVFRQLQCEGRARERGLKV